VKLWFAIVKNETVQTLNIHNHRITSFWDNRRLALLIKNNALHFFRIFLSFRLEGRFITPSTAGSSSSTPTFPGYQEFFKSFISVASDFRFNQLLTNGLVDKINEVGYLRRWRLYFVLRFLFFQVRFFWLGWHTGRYCHTRCIQTHNVYIEQVTCTANRKV